METARFVLPLETFLLLLLLFQSTIRGDLVGELFSKWFAVVGALIVWAIIPVLWPVKEFLVIATLVVVMTKIVILERRARKEAARRCPEDLFRRSPPA